MLKTKVLLPLACAAVCFLAARIAPAQTAYNDAVLSDNPLLYWTFDEASGNAISQVNNTAFNELTPMGAATRAPSTMTAGGVSLGSAASFNGANGTRFRAADLMGPPNGGGAPNAGTGFIGSQLWATEFWFNTSSSGAQYISESTGGGGNNNPSFIYGFNAGGPDELEMFTGGRTGVANVSQNEWHHAVFAFYGNSGGFEDNLREIYLDGQLVQSDTTSTFSAGHALEGLSIGSTDVSGGVNPFSGLIDEYAIYELGDLPDLAARQAAVADIADHFNVAPAAVPEPASILAWIAIGLALVPGAWWWRRRRV